MWMSTDPVRFEQAPPTWASMKPATSGKCIIQWSWKLLVRQYFPKRLQKRVLGWEYLCYSLPWVSRRLILMVVGAESVPRMCKTHRGSDQKIRMKIKTANGRIEGAICRPSLCAMGPVTGTSSWGWCRTDSPVHISMTASSTRLSWSFLPNLPEIL